ncbi:hypothetical protein [Streptomyces sp. WMMB303]|uniref:hypothetical protein n=1 Tax=Streptomyces sp. WMMB303 TaxID=3034154 RepID=UPI0023ED6DEB|nr:hypothetical protein [Streptomyces sp. WMMB303]MDF4252764.1 hypothetical protein [Streptomyces sp. WMMB303]
MTGPSTGRPAAFGALEFQLVLLRRMADFQPGRVDAALRELGVDRAAMREANKRWQAMRHAPRGPSAPYRSVLGPPESTEQRRLGDLGCRAHHWTLPLWRDLRFEVLTAPGGGPAWNAWLVRAPGVPGPLLRTVEDLVPWSCTVDEAARAFARVQPREGSAPNRQRLAFTAPDRTGAPHEVVAEFTWGLLQRLPSGPEPPGEASTVASDFR